MRKRSFYRCTKTSSEGLYLISGEPNQDDGQHQDQLLLGEATWSISQLTEKAIRM
jgi:hypothetical protein